MRARVIRTREVRQVVSHHRVLASYRRGIARDPLKRGTARRRLCSCPRLRHRTERRVPAEAVGDPGDEREVPLLRQGAVVLIECHPTSCPRERRPRSPLSQQRSALVEFVEHGDVET
jgi:hypothetical protein